MKEEEGRRNVDVEAFNVAEKRIKELKSKLLEEKRERKSAVVSLDSAKRQVEGQRVLLCNAKDQLAASNTQVIALKKKLEEAEKAKQRVERARD